MFAFCYYLSVCSFQPISVTCSGIIKLYIKVYREGKFDPKPCLIPSIFYHWGSTTHKTMNSGEMKKFANTNLKISFTTAYTFSTNTQTRYFVLALQFEHFSCLQEMAKGRGRLHLPLHLFLKCKTSPWMLGWHQNCHGRSSVFASNGRLSTHCSTFHERWDASILKKIGGSHVYLQTSWRAQSNRIIRLPPLWYEIIF